MEDRFIILDGAMGTMLQAAGLPVGQSPEVWNVTDPEKVAAVHRQCGRGNMPGVRQHLRRQPP